ncbi:hypothetical protein GCM10009639_61470 [Kitasatospora putterlickiae]|uniref:Uncharacterized protein n=1 Tax=Kitasatospora putterlickiae TaxID=221725 RepID=A0ABP4J7Q3_9ACTN
MGRTSVAEWRGHAEPVSGQSASWTDGLPATAPDAPAPDRSHSDKRPHAPCHRSASPRMLVSAAGSRLPTDRTSAARRKREPGGKPGLSRSGEWERKPSTALGLAPPRPGKRRPVGVRRSVGAPARESEDLPLRPHPHVRAVHGDLVDWVGGTDGCAACDDTPCAPPPVMTRARNEEEDVSVTARVPPARTGRPPARPRRARTARR